MPAFAGMTGSAFKDVLNKHQNPVIVIPAKAGIQS
jgi:hypothetical protein